MTNLLPATSPFRGVHLALLLLALGLLSASAITLAAPAAPASVEVEQAWQKNWKNYARRSIKLRDRFYTCSTFETIYPSSKGVTTTGLRQKTAKDVTERFGSNAKVKKVLVRPTEEIEIVAKALPEVALGHYGTVHSAQILEILGPDEMIVNEIWLLSPTQLQEDKEKEQEKLVKAGLEKQDIKEVLEWMFEARDSYAVKQRDRSFRNPLLLRGFSTVGLAKGDRWSGKDKTAPQVAVVGVESIIPPSSRTRRPVQIGVAVPAELFVKGIADEKEFLALLESRGFTKESFIALVQEEKKLAGTDDKLADAHIFNKLEGRKEEKPAETPAPKTKTKPSF
jgi:hypothetical protein